MFLITEEGLEKLRKELLKRESEKEKALIAMGYARSLGDLSENSELDAARAELERCDSDISNIKTQISHAVLFDVKNIKEDQVGFGATVEIEDEDGDVSVYKILGSVEADLSKNIISMSSPMGKGMLGKSVGDSFKVHRPIGDKEYTVLSISYEKR